MIGSLFEYLIYSAIMVALITYSMSYLVMVHHQIHQQQTIMQCHAQGLLVQSLLFKDMTQATLRSCEWHDYADCTIIWHIGSHEYDVGWQFDGANMYRLQGNYNFEKHAWTTCHKALVAQKVEQFEIKQELAPSRAIRCTCLLKFAATKSSVWQVTLRNGIA
jgi:hypothetical protein